MYKVLHEQDVRYIVSQARVGEKKNSRVRVVLFTQCSLQPAINQVTEHVQTSRHISKGRIKENPKRKHKLYTSKRPTIPEFPLPPKTHIIEKFIKQVRKPIPQNMIGCLERSKKPISFAFGSRSRKNLHEPHNLQRKPIPKEKRKKKEKKETDFLLLS